MILPFALLLGAMAFAPLLRAELVAAALRQSRARTRRGHAWLLRFDFAGFAPRILHTAHDYVSFIALIGSLFVVSGGIHIGVKGGATPLPMLSFYWSARCSRMFWARPARRCC
jgi:hypothetical protein